MGSQGALGLLVLGTLSNVFFVFKNIFGEYFLIKESLWGHFLITFGSFWDDPKNIFQIFPNILNTFFDGN